jgi:hypothetical protein
LREFKATFSIVVCELDLKYGLNYTKAFAFKQLVCYVHYEALDVYEQHSSKILGVIEIPNLVYAGAITTASQATFQVTLQATITHHGIVPNNPNLVLIYFSKHFSSITHCCYRKHSSHHRCTRFC